MSEVNELFGDKDLMKTAGAFAAKKRGSSGKYSTDGKVLKRDGKVIAKWKDDGVIVGQLVTAKDFKVFKKAAKGTSVKQDFLMKESVSAEELIDRYLES